MGIIEIQVRKDRFATFFKAELNRQRLAKPTLDVPILPELQGRLLERIECLNCVVEPSLGAGTVTVQADLVFHFHTSLATVRAAGSLLPPVTEQLHKTLPFVFSIPLTTPGGQPSPPRLQWSMFSGLVTDGMSLDLPKEITVQSAAIEANETVVAIRLGTQVNDPVTDPIVDRLGQGDWVRLISGNLLAEVFTANLAATLTGEGNLPADVKNDMAPAGSWVPFRMGLQPWDPPFVMVAGKLVAEGQCLFGIDIDIDLLMIVQFQASGHQLITTLRLQWDADSTVCDIVSGLLLTPIAGIAIHVIAEDKVAEGILGAATSPDGFQKIAEDDESITYQQTTSVDLQVPGFVLTHSEVTSEGLVAGGTLEIQRGRRGLEGEASAPASILKTDCTARRVSVAFQPATVSLRDIGVGGPPTLFPGGATFDPPGAWDVALGSGNSWLDLVLVFPDPPAGRLPVGTATSVFLHTDCGLRCVDLGVVPADRPQPTTVDMIEMINQCIVLVDPWGDGVLNLGWLVDPPDLLHGITPLRQWAVGLQELPEGARVEVVAVGPDGERSLGTIEGQQNVALQVVTNANETLSLRASGPLSAPAPTVSQGWIAPFAEVPLEGEPMSVAAVGGVLGYLGNDGEIRLIDPSLSQMTRTLNSSGVRADDPVLRLTSALGRKPGRNFDGNATVARVDSTTVAVIHNGSLHIAHAGPMSRL